ncbi:MAG: type II secretion system protein GspD [Candidatus Omnitrophica bacterium]|nr:type II secretion system protein GspD [Candidatus Omnitrophota bacterium]
MKGTCPVRPEQAGRCPSTGSGRTAGASKGLNRTVVALFLTGVALIGLPVYAQENHQQLAQVAGADVPVPVSVADGMNRQVSLDLRGIDIVDAVKYLAVKGNLNVVTTKSVSGQVNLFLQQVTIRDALDILLLANGLALEARGSIFTVMTEAEYEELHGYRYHDQRLVRTLALKYANAPRIAALLEGIRSKIGRIISDEGSGTLILVDVPERMDQMEAAVQMLDLETVIRPAPTVSEVFMLRYNRVEDIQGTLTAALTPGIGTLRFDKKTNTMVISDLPHRMPELRQLVNAFDQKTRQVFIEAQILQVTLSDNFDIGVEWQTIFKNAALNQLTLQATLPSAITSFGKMSIGTINKDQLSATVKALQRFGKTDVLSTPHIAALDGQEATIHVGTKEVYVTSTVSQGTSTATTSESVNFIDVGIKLKVTPSINDDGFITMKIQPEVSSVARTVSTSQGNQIPVVDTSTASTSLMVKDGTTIVMGGLIKNRTAYTRSQIPLLGSLPIVGTAFRFKGDEDIKTELIIFLTPHLITGETPVGPPSNERPRPFKFKEAGQ